MLSLRYAIRQLDIELVSALNAYRKEEDGEGSVVHRVRFSEEDVPKIPVIVKRNTLLFQALERIHAGSDDARRAPSDEVITDLLDDLTVVIWPIRVNKMSFVDSDNAFSISGEELREKMFGEGFDIGDVHMVPLLAGAGMSRSGKYLFIREELRAAALERITLGLVGTDAAGRTCLRLKPTLTNGKGETENVCVNPAKLLAYIGLADTDGVALAELGDIWEMSRTAQQLASGAAQPVHVKRSQRNPAERIQIHSDSVVVVKDAYGPLGIPAIGAHVIRNDNQNEGRVSLKKLSKNDKAACLTDGYGFICPEWSMEIDRMRRCRTTGLCEEGPLKGFRSRAFIIRLPFVKGAVVECDYVRYLRELGVQEIVDMWGGRHPLDGVKMILTESMFKGSKLFPHLLERRDGQGVWEHYCSKLEKSGLSMILAGSDSAPTERTSLNYQFLSSMQPDADSLEALIKWEQEQQESRLNLLKGPGEDGLDAFAKSVIGHLKESVRVEAERQTEQAQEDAVVEAADGTEEAPDGTDTGLEGEELSIDVGQGIEELSIDGTEGEALSIDGTEEAAAAADVGLEVEKPSIDASVTPAAAGAEAPSIDASDVFAAAGAEAPSDGKLVAAKRSRDASYAELLARLLRRYPEAACTRAILEELASITVKAASDVSQGRIRVKGDVRILCGDPFVLLNGIAERAGVKVSHLKLPLLQSCGMVYAPGLKQSELLLLRNPHVSAFEAIVAKNLDIACENNSVFNARDKYHTYFGQHRGVIFINSAVASTLGGADFDGDRAKVVCEPSAIQLVKSNTERIYALLKASEDSDFRLPADENVRGKALPIVSITPFSATNLTVEDMNRAFWEKVYDSYLKSINSRVGIYSVRGATLAFNHGMVAAAKLEDSAQVAQAVAFLKTMARLTTVIGLDIDAAKSGTPPKEPRLGKIGSMAPMLRFSRRYKKSAFPDSTGLARYKFAYNATVWEPNGEADASDEAGDAQAPGEGAQEIASSAEAAQGAQRNSSDKANSRKNGKAKEEALVYDLLKGSEAASVLVERFRLCDQYDVLQRWLPLAKWKQPPKEETSFASVLCADLEDAPDANMRGALAAAGRIVERASATRSAAGKRIRAAQWTLQRRVDIQQHLLRYYPLRTALDLDERIVAGAKDAVEKLGLESDGELIRYAFCTNAERREALKATIFGSQADDGFIYDVTAIQLAKHVQRLREACKSQGEDRDHANVHAILPVSYAQQRNELYRIAAEHGVDRWTLGLWMLKEGRVQAKDFVLLFVGDMDPSEEKEVGTHEQPAQGSK